MAEATRFIALVGLFLTILALLMPLAPCVTLYGLGFSEHANTVLARLVDEVDLRSSQDSDWDIPQDLLRGAKRRVAEPPLDPLLRKRLVELYLSLVDASDHNVEALLSDINRAQIRELQRYADRLRHGTYRARLRAAVYTAPVRNHLYLGALGVSRLAPRVYRKLFGVVRESMRSRIVEVFAAISALALLIATALDRSLLTLVSLGTLASIGAAAWGLVKYFFPAARLVGWGAAAGMGLSLIIAAATISLITIGVLPPNIPFRIESLQPAEPSSNPPTGREPGWAALATVIAIGLVGLVGSVIAFMKARRSTYCGSRKLRWYAGCLTTGGFSATAVLLGVFVRDVPHFLFVPIIAILMSALATFAAALVIRAKEHHDWCVRRRTEGIAVKFFLPAQTRILVFLLVSYSTAAALDSIIAVVFGGSIWKDLRSRSLPVQAAVIGLFIYWLGCFLAGAVMLVVQHLRARRENARAEEARINRF